MSRLGLAAAKKAFLKAHAFSADELLQVDYLDALVPADKLDAVIEDWIGQLLELAPLALVGMKQSLNDLARSGLSVDTLTSIRMRESVCARSQDFAEGRLAFEKKRDPLFRGI